MVLSRLRGVEHRIFGVKHQISPRNEEQAFFVVEHQIIIGVEHQISQCMLKNKYYLVLITKTKYSVSVEHKISTRFEQRALNTIWS